MIWTFPVVGALLALTIACAGLGMHLMRRRERVRVRHVVGAGSPYRTRPPRDAAAVVEAGPRWWGKHGILADGLVALSLASAAALFSVIGTGDDDVYERRWTFTRDGASAGELGLAVSSDLAGVWRLESDARATGARALVNHAGTPGAPPATAVAVEAAQRDVRVRTRCRVRDSGSSRACGLVFRYLDDANHYAARLDAAEQAIVLTAVRDGAARHVARAKARLAVDVWQEIAVEARRNRIRVLWNGEPTIDVRDSTLSAAGAAGLWTPAEGVAHFDELWVEDLPTGMLPVLTPGPVLPPFAG